MKILDRYVTVLFLKFFLGAIILLVTLFTLILFFELIGDFVNFKAPLFLILNYFANKLPEAAYYMTPMAVLGASILSLSMMSKDKEIMILMSCGVSPFRISLPLIAGTAMIALLTFADSEFIMPHTWIKSEDIYRRQVKKIHDVSSLRQNMAWVKTATEDVWNVGFLDAPNGLLYDINVMRFTPDRSTFAFIVSAKKGYKTGDGWVFENGIERRFGPDGSVSEEAFDKKKFLFQIDFNELKHTVKVPQEMNFSEITRYIDHIRKAGYNDIRYSVDRYVKITFPLISVVMTFISIPFGLRTSRMGGAFSGITIAVTIGFVFWFLFSMGVSLGHSGKLSPLIAAGGAHVLFILAAIFALLSGLHSKEGFFNK